MPAPSMCLDHYGHYILPLRRFQPISSDHCTQCVCINGQPSQCLTIKCTPPTNCHKKSTILQKKGSCCEFVCLDSDEEEDASVERNNKPMKHSTYSESTIDHLDQLNDLEMNGNVQSGVQSGLKNVVQQSNNQLTDTQSKSNTSALVDKRYSNLESTLKKLIANKNALRSQEEVTKNFTHFNDEKQMNPAFRNLGIGVGIGNGNADSGEVQSKTNQLNKPERINYSNSHQTIYSPPRNKYSNTLANESIRNAGKKYGIYGANVYHNNLGNNFNHNSSQYSDEYPYVSLNDFMRNRQFNRNYVHATGANFNPNLQLNSNNSNLWWFTAQNVGLRLIGSTVCTFLILALLFFLIHRLRQRRLLVMIRRLQNRRESNGQHTHGLPCFQGDLSRSCFVEAPPSYFSTSSLYPGFWKPNCNANSLVAPGEPPPAYEDINNHQTPSFSNPLLNINPTDTTANQLTCFTNSNLLSNANCYTAVIGNQRLDGVQANSNVNTGNYEVPYNQNTTTLKTNQIVRTSQPAHSNFRDIGPASNSPNKISKLGKHFVKKNHQLDKLRHSLTGQQVPTSTRTLVHNNELVEAQNFNNSIIEDQLFKATNDSVCRLLINNVGQNDGQLSDQSNINRQINQPNYQASSRQANHSQSVDNLTGVNKSIGNRLLDFYNNNVSNQQAFTNQTYSTIGKGDRSFNSNLSLRTKYQRCVVNIPNLPTVFKSAFANQPDQLNNQFDNNFNDNESLASEEIPSPAPEPPVRKVSLPVELRDEEHGFYQAANRFLFNDSNDLKSQTKCLSFNHSTPAINNPFRYNLYLNKLKEDEYHKQLEQTKLSESSTNESLANAISSMSGLKSADVSKIDKVLKSDSNDGQKNGQDEEIRPSTSASSNTTRIMVNYK